MAPAQEKQVGGIKGFLLRAGKSFSAAGTVAGNWTWWLAQRGGRLGLVLASTSMVVLMPLLFEINREVGVRTCCKVSWYKGLESTIDFLPSVYELTSHVLTLLLCIRTLNILSNSDDCLGAHSSYRTSKPRPQ